MDDSCTNLSDFLIIQPINMKFQEDLMEHTLYNVCGIHKTVSTPQELGGIFCGDLKGTWVQINVVVGFQAYQSTGVCTQWRVGFSE